LCWKCGEIPCKCFSSKVLLTLMKNRDFEKNKVKICETSHWKKTFWFQVWPIITTQCKYICEWVGIGWNQHLHWYHAATNDHLLAFHINFKIKNPWCDCIIYLYLENLLMAKWISIYKNGIWRCDVFNGHFISK
jgi:hypothetical protein